MLQPYARIDEMRESECDYILISAGYYGTDKTKYEK
jgi:hypothetical protein